MGIALVHDILEVFAGDTPLFVSDSMKSAKAELEKTALLQLKKQWPQMKLMHQLIDEYEDRKTAESRFIYALDKLVPMLNNYLDSGRNWKRQGVDLDTVKAAKENKISIDPVINEYYEEILELLKRKPEFFS
jgi:putative hydrolase of HD superfamily